MPFGLKFGGNSATCPSPKLDRRHLCGDLPPGRCPFLALSVQQRAANGSKARHKAKVEIARFYERWRTIRQRPAHGRKGLCLPIIRSRRIPGWPRALEDACGSVERNGAGSIFEKRERSSTVPGAIIGCVGERRCGLVGVRWPSGSGRLPFVPVMKPADLRDRHDATIARRGDRARDRRILVQR